MMSNKRERPKRLRRDGTTISFELDAKEFLVDLNTRPIRRPLPAIHTLLAVAPQRRKSSTDRNADVENRSHRDPSQIPLLLSFIDALKYQYGGENAHDSNDTDILDSTGSKHGASAEHASFDQYSKVLTRAHHKRFRKLLLSFGMNAISKEFQTKAKKKEFQTLCELFREERKLYSEALREYCIANAERFHLGFKVPCTASQFVDSRSQYIHSYKKAWLSSMTSEGRYYGPCIQTISVNHRSSNYYSGSETIHGGTNAQITLIETMSPKFVFQRTIGKPLSVVNVERLREVLREGTCLRAQKNIVRSCPESFLLCKDADAQRLAEEYNAQVVLTDRVMMSLIKDSKWILPLSQKQVMQSNNRSKVIVYIEDPLPTSCFSRDCLSFGLLDSLYGSLCLDSSDTGIVPTGRQYNYTVLNFVGTSSSFRVLVRSETFLLDEDGGPLSLDVSLEYFPDRGMEIIPVRDRTQWLVQKMLHSKTKQLLFRIDPETAKILCMEEKGVADVLTSEDPTRDEKGANSLGDFESVENDSSPDELIQRMMELCYATTKLKHDFSSRNIICYPARYQLNTSIASHQVASVHKETKDASLVDVIHEIDDSYQVLLTPTFRQWSWTHDRVPYTFPWKDEEIFHAKRT